MQCTNLEATAMSFDFSSSNINPIKAQATYKDGGGLGGGGMYMKQGKKEKEQEQEEELFAQSVDKNEDEFVFESDVKEKDIPQDTLFNKFVNWFRIQS